MDFLKDYIPYIVTVLTAFIAYKYAKIKGQQQAEEKLAKVNSETIEHFEKLVETMSKRIECLEEESTKQTELIKKLSTETRRLKKDLEIYYCANAPTCAKNSRRKSDLEQETEI